MDNAADDARAPYNVIRFRGNTYNSRQFPRVLLEILRIKPSSYDFIHAAEWSFVLGMAVLQPLKKMPFTATMHGTDIIGFHTSRLAKILRAEHSLGKADKILANSNYTNKLVQQYNPSIDPKKVVTTLLGVSPFWFERPHTDPAHVLQKYGIDASKKIILTVARLDERKGHAEVLRGLKALPAVMKDNLTYVIVGKADNEDQLTKLEKLAAQSDVDVKFTGPIPTDDVKCLYAVAWLYCMPAISNPLKVEGFGLVYLEAAAQGLPSLATPLGGVPEVVLHGKTGVLVDDTAPATIAGAIVDLYENPQKYGALKSACIDWAKGFSWERCARESYGGL